MPAGGAIAVGAGAAIGGAASLFGGKSAAGAQRSAAEMQLQAAREAIRAQTQGAERAFDIFQSESAKSRKFLTNQAAAARRLQRPLYQFGLRSLQTAEGFTDPNSELANQERAAFGRTLAANLAARGLTGSGTEIAGLSDFEQGLARERRNLALNLAGVGAGAISERANIESNLGSGLAGLYQNLGSTGASIFGNLGQNVGNTLFQSGQMQGNSLISAAQAQAQGLIGAGNAFQTGLLGLANLQQNQAAQANANQQYNSLLGLLGGGNSLSSGGGGQMFSKSGLNWNNPFAANI